VRDPCGESFVLDLPPYSAEVTEIGACLRTLTHDGVDLVAGWPRGEPCPHAQGWVLMPWPNRVVDASWRQGELVHHLPVTEPESGSALHGLVGRLPWEPVEQARSSVRLRRVLEPGPGYPFSLEVEADYRLDRAGLRVDLTATNTGRDSAPYGVGHHPYLTVGRRVDDVEVTLPARSVAAIGDGGRPEATASVEGSPFDFRAPRRVGAAAIDHAFTDLIRDGATAIASVRDPASARVVRLTIGEGFGWLQVFTADDHGDRAREAVAVEPMSCPPDAFNSGTDLVWLAPGERHRAWFRIDAPA
jgi:aldose 1-epimerase